MRRCVALSGWSLLQSHLRCLPASTSSLSLKRHFALRSGSGKARVCVAGGGGFIGSHLAKRLKSEGHYVVVADWK